MPSSASGIVAAVALMLAGAPDAPAEAVIWVPLCNGGAMPLGGQPQPGKDHPAGCHAACLSRRDGPEDGGGEDCPG